MTVIDLNEIFKIKDYKHILSFKVLDIASHLRPWAKNQGFRVCSFESTNCKGNL